MLYQDMVSTRNPGLLYTIEKPTVSEHTLGWQTSSLSVEFL